MRPKSEIYTPKRDDEHPHPFPMRSSPLPPGVQVNSVLKSLLHAFTHTQTTPVESDDEDIKPKFYQEALTTFL